MFNHNAFARFQKCTGLPFLPAAWISLFKNAANVVWKKYFCCELYAKALINALSHLLCFVLGKILICLLLCFYNSLLFLHTISRQGIILSGMTDSVENFLFYICLFSTGIMCRWTMKKRSKVCLRKAPPWPFHLSPHNFAIFTSVCNCPALDEEYCHLLHTNMIWGKTVLSFC